MLERADALGRTLTLEGGKPLAEARGEIAYAASFFGWFAGEAERVYGRTIPASQASKRLMVLLSARRRRRRHHAVEFSGGHGDTQSRPSDRGRVLGRAQASRADAAHGDRHRRDSRRGGIAAGRCAYGRHHERSGGGGQRSWGSSLRWCERSRSPARPRSASI